MLYAETLDRLRRTEIPLTQLSSETGLNLNWLKKIKSGSIADPGVRKIERLYKFLSHSSSPDTTSGIAMPGHPDPATFSHKPFCINAEE